MSRRIFFSLGLLFLVVSCSLHNRELLPEIVRSYEVTPALPQSPVVFPAGRWQFVHSISFHLAKGGDGTSIGVLALDSREIHCVLITVEGLTLFEARSMEGGPIEVIRAVPPFDNQEFAAGLMGDVRMIFQKPQGLADKGRLAGGAPVFRYSATGQETDILPQEDGCWTMNTYSEQVRVRTIRTRSCRMVDSAIIPEDIDLVSDGPVGYALHLHLISVEKL
jgi:hypothetical protein